MNSDDTESRAHEKLADRLKRSLDPASKKEVVDRIRNGDVSIPIPMETDDPFRVGRGRGFSDDITQNITKALRINESSNQEGEAAISSLGKQREVLQRTLSSVADTNDNLWQGRKILRDIKLAVWKERFIKSGIIAFLVSMILLIIYVKWLRK